MEIFLGVFITFISFILIQTFQHNYQERKRIFLIEKSLVKIRAYNRRLKKFGKKD